MAVKRNKWKIKFIPCVNISGIVVNHRSLIKYGGGVALPLSDASRLNCGNESFLRNAVSTDHLAVSNDVTLKVLICII